VVTGAAGFVGSHLVDALCAEGYDVTGIDAFLDRPYPSTIKRATAASVAAHPRCRFVAADLRTHRLDGLLRGADAVVHAAALPGLAHTHADPLGAWGHNAWATARLVVAARDAGVRRFVHVSTSSVYGAHAVGDERQPQRPVSVYGRSKQAAERIVLRAARAGDVDAVVVRYFSIYGPRQRPDMAYHRFIAALLEGRAVTVHGDGRQRRSVTYIADAVAGTIAALKYGERGEAYNLGGGVSVDVLEAVELIAAAVDTKPLIRFARTPPGDQRATAADCTKAAVELGWTARVGPAEGIRRQVAWHMGRDVLDRRLASAAKS
jgi:nucleoside-diphosphate-sugar epimerase